MTTKSKPSPPAPASPASAGGSPAELITQLVGQWNQLESTTNWEKGRIICDWREALMIQGAAVTEYSDEAWAQLVGGVTSQHVGRLRRVYQRFGETQIQYPGLYWSHFQATLDWDDAPMWLEGAIQNEWSVSQMRGKRWETLGTPPEEQQAAYPLRPVAKLGHEADLKKRTLTNLYNARPAWLANAHAELDAAVAAAYGWADYTSEMSDEEILRRLLVLNFARN